MKICRFEQRGSQAQYGRLDGISVTPFGTDSFADVLAGRYSETMSIAIDDVKLLAPVRPGKIIGVGRNYADHAKELGNEVPQDPLLFLKPPSAVLNPGDPIVRPEASQRVDFEGELAVVIGQHCRQIEEGRWREYVYGFTCGNDVTARDLQKKDVQFTRAKGFDTFCPLGPWIETDLDVSDLELTTRLRGEVKQHGRTSQMIFAVPFLVAYISGIMTLEAGDVILTGTPSGVGAMESGDVVEIEIDGIGTLPNPVA
jgi:2-keto-4-pentenoate hydratase/2-oxohepta-3-ene-1,7-dioic acid hydratase in catechol pathway